MIDKQPLSAAVQNQLIASQPSAAIRSWADLAAVPTFYLVLPVVKIWVEEATGIRQTVRLLRSTTQTDLASGILRPNDYDPALNPRVWFRAT